MPIVKLELAGKIAPEKKQDLMEFIADQIYENTGTLKKNIYVYIHEWELENVRKHAPVALIDWTEQAPRTPEAKMKIMSALTDRLAEVTGQEKKEIVILFTDIPLKNAMLGGISRYDNPTW
ncbi:MAG: tautomerase family protein [Oscillospiraceae bacterium]|nr:tautomerase family protein [Oscillospiraceae bacterium]